MASATVGPAGGLVGPGGGLVGPQSGTFAGTLSRGITISAVPVALQNVSAVVRAGRVLFDLTAPSDRLSRVLIIALDYPYYLEV